MKQTRTKEDYRTWVSQNDTYPEHEHTFAIRAYDKEGMWFRTFGPFQNPEKAKEWFHAYREKYTTKGFLPRYEVVPLCEPLSLD